MNTRLQGRPESFENGMFGARDHPHERVFAPDDNRRAAEIARWFDHECFAVGEPDGSAKRIEDREAILVIKDTDRDIFAVAATFILRE